MSKKAEFVEAYKLATGVDPSTIKRDDKREAKIFRNSLIKHKLVSLFVEAVEEANEAPDEDAALKGMGSLFGAFDL